MKHLDPSECLPIPLTTIKELSDTKYHFKTCLNTSSLHQWRRLRYERSQCKNPCNIVEYIGRSQEHLDKDDKKLLTLIIYFVSNEIKVQEQYFIYSDVDLIGIVGGNLGLFIGFSFFDKIKQLISFITNRLHN